MLFFLFSFFANILLDTPSDLLSVTDASSSYVFQKTNIAWPTDKEKYRKTQYKNSEIVPPPNWSLRYPNGTYTDQYPAPDLSTMENFMVWMHTAALPDFRKIWGRNDNQNLEQGRWRIRIDLSKNDPLYLHKHSDLPSKIDFDTTLYGGNKWLVISTTSPLGGRNPYLGIAYMGVGGIAIFLGIVFTLRHIIKPR